MSVSLTMLNESCANPYEYTLWEWNPCNITTASEQFKVHEV
jgi:hypothetical protein